MNQAPVWPIAPLSLENLISVGAEQFERQQCFFGHGTDNAWDEALSLALYALDLTWDVDESILRRSLSQKEVDDIAALFNRRITDRLPAAYLTGRMFFAGLEFIVNENVLVPRSPIAELIRAEFQPWLRQAPAKILDLCTGGACIGIACAHYFPEATVDCSDISSAALQVATKNIKLHQLQDRVNAIESDLFERIDEAYDLIVSNPPYVDAKDLAAMPREYHAEPAIGLAAGDDGLDICRRILRDAGQYLTANGSLVVEVGNSWQALEQAFPQVPFTWIEFADGGHGVFVLTAQELSQYRPYFVA